MSRYSDLSKGWGDPISRFDTPDPWMISVNGHYYLTFTSSDHIEIWRSDDMHNFATAQKNIVWHPTPGSPWSDAIWAPELHYLEGTWYIYSAAAQPGQGNVSHRTIILRCSSQDPMQTGSWEFLGPLKGLPDHWHIDATVFSPSSGELYCCYSGWPLGDFSDTEQVLFLIKMKSPEHAIRETLTIISKPELSWERPDGGRRGVNEGMAWVNEPFFRGIVFSANGSWTCDYKLGLLRLVGKDLLDPASWQKRPTPLLMSKAHHYGPYGPGHASFMSTSLDAIDCIFHATDKSTDGWANRKARVMNMLPSQFAQDARPICCPGPVHGRDGQESASTSEKQQRQTRDNNPPGSGNGQDTHDIEKNQAGKSPATGQETLGRRLKKGFLKRLC